MWLRGQQLFESVLVENAEFGVAGCDDGAGSRLTCQRADFAEDIATGEHTDGPGLVIEDREPAASDKRDAIRAVSRPAQRLAGAEKKRRQHTVERVGELGLAPRPVVHVTPWLRSVASQPPPAPQRPSKRMPVRFAGPIGYRRRFRAISSAG